MPTKTVSARSKLKIPVEDIHVPASFTAWPTITLECVVILTLVFSYYNAMLWNGSWLLSSILIGISFFVNFTPMHDASHRAVSKRFRWLNELVGHIAGIIFLAPFEAFRYCHLKHHKYTNDEEKDPDYFAGRGPAWFQPMRWASTEFYYYGHYFSFLFQRPWIEVLIALVELISMYSVYFYFAYANFTAWLLLLEVPRRCAISALAWTFDDLPHRPHKISSTVDPFKATSKLGGVLSANADGSGAEWLDWILLYQSYHNIHHLYSQIPFYRYIYIWRKHRDELLRLGTPIGVAYDVNRGWTE